MSSSVQYMQSRTHNKNPLTKIPLTKKTAQKETMSFRTYTKTPTLPPLSGFIPLKAIPLQRLASVKGNTLWAETAAHSDRNATGQNFMIHHL